MSMSNLGETQPETWQNELPRAIAECLADREEPEASITAQWLKKHENDDIVWHTINRFLDELQILATMHKDCP